MTDEQINLVLANLRQQAIAEMATAAENSTIFAAESKHHARLAALFDTLRQQADESAKLLRGRLLTLDEAMKGNS